MENSNSGEFDEHMVEFRKMRPVYQALANEVEDIVRKALSSSDIELSDISSRAKEPESFLQKMGRKSYSNPLDDIEDLAGVRVVCLYDSDRTKIVEILRPLFELVHEHDSGAGLGADRMGYIATHLVVRLGQGYSGGRYHGITQFKCEVQIRTVVQDAWAMISHRLVYKQEEDVPSALRRDLNHAATLLEIAQGHFDDLRNKRSQYVDEIRESQARQPDFLQRAVDFDTIKAYSKWKFPDLEPEDRIVSALLRDLDHTRYKTLSDIDRAIERAKPAVEVYSRENPKFFRHGTDFITKSLGFVDPDFRLKHGFAQITRDAIDRLSHLVAADLFGT